MRHVTEYTKWGLSQWTGRCSCGERFGTTDEPLASRQAVEDATYRHMQEVERLRAKIRGGTPTLKTTHAYYVEQATDPLNSESDRDQWQRLADEIAVRLGHDTTDEEQPALPFD